MTKDNDDGEDNVFHLPSGKMLHIEREEMIEIIGEVVNNVLEEYSWEIAYAVMDELEEQLENYQ